MATRCGEPGSGFKRPTSHVQRSTFNLQLGKQGCGSRRWTLNVFYLKREFGPNRCMIRWVLPFAHFAIDSGIAAFLRQLSPGEDRIDPQPAILRERKHPVIPPAENPRLRMVQTQGIGQAYLAKHAKGGAFIIGVRF